MKNHFFLLPILMLLPFMSMGQAHTFINDKIKCLYETKDGRMNGDYVSYYKNGHKKAEGEFENNNRTGTWIVYDTTGQMKIKRTYTGPFDYEQTIYQLTKINIKEITNNYKSNLDYNPNGYIDYFELEEKMVVWSKRIWRYIKPAENKVLFENNTLLNLLLKNLTDGNIHIYSDYTFYEAVPRKYDAADYRTVAYKIVEDNVFDNVRALFEARPIGLCPVVVNVHTKDTTDLGWFYFPAIRKILAQEMVTHSYSPHINTLDDLFFYRNFYGRIYKEENVFDRPISSYLTDETEIARESVSIEISLIEIQHDIWLILAQ